MRRRPIDRVEALATELHGAGAAVSVDPPSVSPDPPGLTVARVWSAAGSEVRSASGRTATDAVRALGLALAHDLAQRGAT